MGIFRNIRHSVVWQGDGLHWSLRAQRRGIFALRDP